MTANNTKVILFKHASRWELPSVSAGCIQAEVRPRSLSAPVQREQPEDDILRVDASAGLLAHGFYRLRD